MMQSIISRPARRRTAAVVVETADVADAPAASGAVVEGTELAGAAPGAGGSEEEHAPSQPKHNTPATAARLALPITCLLECAPDTGSLRHHRAHRGGALAGPNVPIGEPVGATTAPLP
jgi:hypothetical protein